MRTNHLHYNQCQAEKTQALLPLYGAKFPLRCPGNAELHILFSL